MIGGQDEIAFEGPSFGLNADHSLALQLPAFRPMVARIVWERGDKAGDAWKARARSSRRGKKPILRPKSWPARPSREEPASPAGCSGSAPFPASQLAPHHPELSLAYSASMDSMTAFKAGASFVTIPQRIASSIRKYSWRMRFPIPLICAQGSVGNSASQSSGMRRTASEIVLDRAGRGAAGDRVAPKGVERHSRGHVVQNCDLRQAIPNGDCRVLWHHATLTASRSMLVFIIG